MEANTLSPLPSNLDKQNWILGNTISFSRNVIFKNCVSYFTKFDHVDKMLSGKQSREKFAFLVCGLSDIVELFYLNLQFRTNCVMSIKGLFDILILFLLLWKWDFFSMKYVTSVAACFSLKAELQQIVCWIFSNGTTYLSKLCFVEFTSAEFGCRRKYQWHIFFG